MRMDNELMPVLDEVDLLVAELRELRESGPYFRIYHRFHKPGTICAPGEEIVAVCLVHRGQEYPLRLSLSLRILFDYMARHSHLSQNASQIAAGIRADPFYTRHASNSGMREAMTRRICRSYIRVYMPRLHKQLTKIFQKAGLLIEGRSVVRGQKEVVGSTAYALDANVVVMHIS